MLFGKKKTENEEIQRLRAELIKTQKALMRSRERADYLCHSVPSFVRMKKAVGKMSNDELAELMTLLMDEMAKKREEAEVCEV